MKGKFFTILLVLIFIGSAGMFAYSRMEAQRSQEAKQAAEELARAEAEKAAEETAKQSKDWQEMPVTDDPFLKEMETMDLTALRDVNEDVLGWIEIPGTKLAYPLMEGLDNQYYLNHTWEKKPNQAGSVFLERVNQKDLSDFHTIIYGHRQLDGSMFGSLKYYEEKAHWAEHPYVYILNDTGVHRYEIFAAYEAAVGSRTYQVGFADDNSKQAFLDYCVDSSDIETGVIPTLEDKILTLSTCTAAGSNSSRWVVQARLVGMME